MLAIGVERGEIHKKRVCGTVLLVMDYVLFFVAVGHDYVSGDKLIDLLEHGTVEVFGCMIIDMVD